MARKPKILIFTDSVSLPRKLDEGYVIWEDTYIYKLKEAFPNYEFITVTIGGATISDIRKQVDYFNLLSPKFVILQCGIVDCAPRAFSKFEMIIINKFRLKKITKPFVHFLRKYRSHNYTKIKRYEKILKEIKRALKPEVFFSLSILPSCDAFEKKAPGVTKNIEKYNHVLEKNSRQIDLSSIPRNGILNDHHHINEIGQEHIFNCIREELNNVSK